MSNLNSLKKDVRRLSSPERAKSNQWFFKTGPGEYGEGDVFIGLTMPKVREIAKKYIHLNMNEVEELLQSEIHEERMIALVIWTYQFEKADEKVKKEIYQRYLKNTSQINNWDLVDVTTPRIVGGFLLDKKKKFYWEFVKIFMRFILLFFNEMFID